MIKIILYIFNNDGQGKLEFIGDIQVNMINSRVD